VERGAPLADLGRALAAAALLDEAEELARRLGSLATRAEVAPALEGLRQTQP
jgi:hypothetical protein